jgi:cysteine desulfurase
MLAHPRRRAEARAVIYLDYNATTPLAPEAFEAMRPFLEQHHGNPSSIHWAGRETRAAIDDARDRLAKLVGGRPHEIIFTGGGTEANNLAIFGLARKHANKGRHLITCATEHHAVLHPLEWLGKHEGFRVDVLPVDSDGRLDPATLRAAITPETTLVSIMTANNETGIRHPVEELGEVCRERGVLFHTDAIQSFGKDPMRAFPASAFDAVSLAAHKFYGPKGVGALWVRSGIALDRLTHGGSHEGERRPGTENVAGIVGMVAAAELAVANVESESARLLPLREQLWAATLAAFPNAIRHGAPENSLANTLNVSFPSQDGEALLISLDLAGIAASSGSACMVGSIQPSHVLLALGVPTEIAQATVRFSMGKETTAEQIAEVATKLRAIAARLAA